jgi:hypothetical protein
MLPYSKVAGCLVLEGQMMGKKNLRVMRQAGKEMKEVYRGKTGSLRRNKVRRCRLTP